MNFEYMSYTAGVNTGTLQPFGREYVVFLLPFGVLTSLPGLNDHPSKCFIGPVTLGEDVC